MTGTSSATVIQSMPSMKLVRLTNHRQAMSRSTRSIHQGSIGSTRRCRGKLARIRIVQSVCRKRRGATSTVQMSSAAPTSAMHPVGREDEAERSQGEGRAMKKCRSSAGGSDGCGHDRDATALRCRLAVRRARIGITQRHSVRSQGRRLSRNRQR